MNKCSQEFLSPADDCLHQFAQTESDDLSSILNSDDLNSFQDYREKPETISAAWHPKKGPGFPILGILVLICLGSDALLDFAVAAYEGKETGEQALLRKLFSHLQDGDILSGDANFENCFLLALLLQAWADVVFEKNGARHIVFRKCNQKPGSKDGLFKLTRPVRPEWMSQELYDQMPEELVIRAVKNKRRTIMTTLLDAKEYPRSEIIALYLKRWHVEIDFDVIKTTMKMDMLRCKSPEMVRKEISINFRVYNLIRALMGKTAKHIDKTPREVSFKTAQETLASFLQTLLGASGDCWNRKSLTCWTSQDSILLENDLVGRSQEPLRGCC